MLASSFSVQSLRVSLCFPVYRNIHRASFCRVTVKGMQLYATIVYFIGNCACREIRSHFGYIWSLKRVHKICSIESLNFLVQ